MKVCPECLQRVEVDGKGHFVAHLRGGKGKRSSKLSCPGSGISTKHALRVPTAWVFRGGLPGLGKRA